MRKLWNRFSTRLTKESEEADLTPQRGHVQKFIEQKRLGIVFGIFSRPSCERSPEGGSKGASAITRQPELLEAQGRRVVGTTGDMTLGARVVPKCQKRTGFCERRLAKGDRTPDGSVGSGAAERKAARSLSAEVEKERHFFSFAAG